MDNIYLIRHAQSVANLDATIYRSVADHAVPLSDRGIEQAHLAAQKLASLITLPSDAPVRIWTSPYKRTRQTADALEAHLTPRFSKLDRREDILLCEQQFGLFDGIPDEQLAEKFPEEYAHYSLAKEHEGRFWARMPLGESRFDVAVRIHQAFSTFHRDSDRSGIRDIIVVCHGVALRAFAMQWMHLPYEWFERQPNPKNCAIYHIRKQDHQYTGSYIFDGFEY